MKMKLAKRKLTRRSRANLRRRLEQSVKNSRSSHLNVKAPLTISRTVEMVNQKGEDWRCRKSQLLFMTGLGLTPVESWTGITPFTLIVPDTFVFQDESNERRNASSETDSTEVSLSDSGISSISEDTSVSSTSDLNDDCVCIGVFKFLPGYPSIQIAVTKDY